MKIYQFLNNFHYASSSVKHVFVHQGLKSATELYLREVVDPKNFEENPHRELLKMTFNGFRIVDDRIDIFAK